MAESDFLYEAAYFPTSARLTGRIGFHTQHLRRPHYRRIKRGYPELNGALTWFFLGMTWPMAR